MGRFIHGDVGKYGSGGVIVGASKSLVGISDGACPGDSAGGHW